MKDLKQEARASVYDYFAEHDSEDYEPADMMNMIVEYIDKATAQERKRIESKVEDIELIYRDDYHNDIVSDVKGKLLQAIEEDTV